MAFNRWETGFSDNPRIFSAAVAGLHDNPMDHFPLDAVFGTFEMSCTIRTVNKRALEVTGKAPPVKSLMWEVAVMIACPRSGQFDTIANAGDALRILTSAWPVGEGRAYIAALEMCGADPGTFSQADVRMSFLAAAAEAGVAFDLIAPFVVV